MSSTQQSRETQAPQDELGAHLLPALIHRANNSTQLLSNLAVLARTGAGPGGLSWLDQRASDLQEASRNVDQVGYLLAVLASASGSNLLLERRAARGLGWMIAAVGEALARAGRRVAPHSQPTPEQAADVARGWELPWAAGALLLRSGLSCDEGTALEWQWLEEPTHWILVCACATPGTVSDLAPRISTLLPEAALDICPRGWSWRLPAAWLRRA